MSNNSDNWIDPKEVNEALAPDLPEAPLSIHIDSYYKGFHAGIPIRMADNSIVPVSKIMTAIDSLIKSGFQPSWNTSTNEAHQTPPASLQQATVPKPTPVPVPVAQYDEEQGKQADCKHVHFQYKQAGGLKKPENKGRWYKTCADCKAFLGFQDEEKK